MKFARLTKLLIEESINEHATAYISGVLDEQMSVTEVYRLSINSNICIKAMTEPEVEVLFAGVPVDMTLKNLSGVKHLELTLKSHSFKLDTDRINRSFQDVNNPYSSIFRQVVESKYQGAVVVEPLLKNKSQGRLVIQYEETDWQLLKRVASHLGTVIFPHMEATKPQIGVGILDGHQYTENAIQFEIKKAVGAYQESTGNFQGWNELDFVSIDLESTKVYRLCDIVLFNDVKYLVAGKRSEICHGVLVNAYQLQPLSSFRQNIFYNENLVGVSVEGTVVDVESDKVRLHLLMDKQRQSAEAVYWFNCDTFYVAEGHTGGYIMPEKGELVQLYFPNRDEHKAYVRKARRQDGTGNANINNPDTKHFETADGKALMVSPDSVKLSAGHGKIRMQMTDGGGILFSSSEDLRIQGSEINLNARRIRINAGDTLKLKTNSASVMLDSIVDIKGVGVVNFFS